MASYARGESPPAFSSKSSFAFPPTSSEAAPYILHLAALSSAAGPSGYVCSTSDPSTGLSLFDERLQPLRKIETGPRQRVTEIKVVQVGGSGDQGVVASFAEGASVGIWDVRSPSKTLSIELRGSERIPILCCDVAHDGWTVATGLELRGSDAFLDLWDLRKPAAYLIRYPEAHSDDITSVSFSPCSLPLPTASSSSPAPLLLSSSASGLVALHNPLLADEDDALLHATDVGASVARAGFMGSPSLGPQPTDSNPTGIQGLVWARTDMDTLHSFDLDGLTKVTDWGSVKDEAVSRPTARWADSVDYIVACEWLEGAPGRLTYLAGSQTGDLALVALDDPSPRPILADLPGSAAGHSDIVRCGVVDVAHQRFVTGGEDGKLCLWSLNQSGTPVGTGASVVGVSGGAARGSSAGQKGSSRFKPY